MKNSEENSTQEVDILDLFKIFKKAGQKIEHFFLRIINFFIRNAIVIAVLIVLGVVAGYVLDKRVIPTYQTTLVIPVAFSTGEYLKDFSEDFNAKNPVLLQAIGVETTDFNSLQVKPLTDLKQIEGKEHLFLRFVSENNILEKEELKKTILDKASRVQLSLTHPKTINGQQVLTKVLDYLRKNEYYKQLAAIYKEQLAIHIQSNLEAEKQLDKVLNTKLTGAEKLPYSINGEAIDFENYVLARKQLQKHTLDLQKEEIAHQEFLKPITKGSAKQVQGFSFYGKRIYVFPIAFIFLYIAFILFVRMLKKARKLNKA